MAKQILTSVTELIGLSPSFCLSGGAVDGPKMDYDTIFMCRNLEPSVTQYACGYVMSYVMPPKVVHIAHVKMAPVGQQKAIRYAQ